MTPLTAKQARFVAEYLVDLNATRAAKTAGYHPKMAANLMAKAGIKALIAEKTAKQLEKVDLTAEQVKQRIATLAFQDVRAFFDAAGNLLPVQRLSDEAASQIASFEIIKKNAAAGDGVIDTVHKIRTVDAVKNLEILAKHFGLLKETVEVQGGLTITWQDGTS